MGYADALQAGMDRKPTGKPNPLGFMNCFSCCSPDREIHYVNGYVEGILKTRPLTELESQYYELVKTKASCS